MCNFFSFVTDPVGHPGEYYFLDWEYRKANLIADDADSHSHICKKFNLREDVCNKYEFNPLTKRFVVDQINSERDDSEAAQKWANRLDFKTVIEPLIVKSIINPLKLPKVEKPTDEQIGWLKEWDSIGASVLAQVWDQVRASVGASVRNSVWDTVWGLVRNSVWDQVRASVGASVRNSVWDTVWASVDASVGAYIISFFAIKYNYASPAVKLLESGLVPSFDGTIWRLHSGEESDVVFEWTPEKGA